MAVKQAPDLLDMFFPDVFSNGFRCAESRKIIRAESMSEGDMLAKNTLEFVESNWLCIGICLHDDCTEVFIPAQHRFFISRQARLIFTTD